VHRRTEQPCSGATCGPDAKVQISWPAGTHEQCPLHKLPVINQTFVKGMCMHVHLPVQRCINAWHAAGKPAASRCLKVRFSLNHHFLGETLHVRNPGGRPT
jgi:hypothetical protein